MLATALLTVTMSVLAPEQIKVTAKPGGKMTYQFNAPVWRDEFITALPVGQTWRFGSNSATTWTTAAGIIFDDLIVFPGTYNIGVRPEAGGKWQLLFHHDGIFPSGETAEGEATLLEEEIPKKRQTKMLEVDIGPNKKAGKGIYQFQATFGPKHMAGNFTTAKPRGIKAKIGRDKVVSTYLRRTDIDDLSTSLDDQFVAMARVTSNEDAKGIRLFLRGGDTPKLAVVKTGSSESRPDHEAKGQRGGVDKPGKEIVHTFQSKDDTVNISFEIGAHSYHFEVPVSVFKT